MNRKAQSFIIQGFRPLQNLKLARYLFERKASNKALIMQPPGYTCQDQEKPLVEAQEDEADAVPIPCPEPEDENVDNNFATFCPPHEGHEIISFLSL